jgi:hypothetical protein
MLAARAQLRENGHRRAPLRPVVHAALVLVQAWIAAAARLGSFQAWAGVTVREPLAEGSVRQSLALGDQRRNRCAHRVELGDQRRADTGA